MAVEVALASALVTLALLLSQSVARLQAVDPGFDPERVLTMRLSLPRARYRHPANAQRFVEVLRPRLTALAGVVDAAAVNVVPLNGHHATADVWPAARPVPAPDQRPQAEYRMISPSYLRTFGIPRSLRDDRSRIATARQRSRLCLSAAPSRDDSGMWGAPWDRR